MAASLNCPNCGAAAPSPTATRCDYCTSALTAMSCPACFGGIFAGMQFCPHCGAKSDRAVGEPASFACPGCKMTMTAVQVGATPMFECPSCESTWLASDTFTKLCLDRAAHGAIAARVGTGKAPPPAPAQTAVRYVPCPLCKRLMNRENFGRRSGVIIDVCKGHGVWFQRHELQGVLAFIDSGGLERARVLDAERMRQDSRRDQRERDVLRRGAAIHASESHIVVVQASSPGESILDEALRLLLSG